MVFAGISLIICIVMCMVSGLTFCLVFYNTLRVLIEMKSLRSSCEFIILYGSICGTLVCCPVLYMLLIFNRQYLWELFTLFEALFMTIAFYAFIIRIVQFLRIYGLEKYTILNVIFLAIMIFEIAWQVFLYYTEYSISNIFNCICGIAETFSIGFCFIIYATLSYKISQKCVICEQKSLIIFCIFQMCSRILYVAYCYYSTEYNLSHNIYFLASLTFSTELIPCTLMIIAISEGIAKQKKDDNLNKKLIPNV